MLASVPCRAQDPHTCKYHGAELRANDALKAGDIDAYLLAQAEMTAAIKTTPEIVEYFVKQRTPAGEAPTQSAAQPPTDAGEPKPARLVQRGFQQADRTRDARLQDHYNNGTPYLVGGTVENVADTEFTAARLVYQRAANLLLQAAVYRKADGQEGYFVNSTTFERNWRTLSDKTATELGLNELATEAEIKETHRTIDQVYRVLGGNFNLRETIAADRSANLLRGLRSLDLAFWNSPHGPGER